MHGSAFLTVPANSSIGNVVLRALVAILPHTSSGPNHHLVAVAALGVLLCHGTARKYAFLSIVGPLHELNTPTWLGFGHEYQKIE